MKMFIFILTLSLSVFAAEETNLTQAEMDKNWVAYATPGPEHAILRDFAGNWSYTTTWQAAPEAKSYTFKGTMKRKMILGGRFLLTESNHKTPWDPYMDHSLLGYNRLAKRYETFNASNKGTGMSFAFGHYDPETKTLTFRGTNSDYASRNHEVETRLEVKITDKNNYTSTFYVERPDGKDFKVTETIHKRK